MPSHAELISAAFAAFLPFVTPALRAQDPTAAPSGVMLHQATAAAVDAHASTYTARLASESVTISVPVAGTAAPATLALRFLGAARGSAAPRLDVRSAPLVRGDRVEFEHGDVVERYAVEPRGLEQSFVFHRRPAGFGDLVLTIAVSGSVTAAAVVAGHQPIDFMQGDAPAIRYGSAIAFDRGQRHRVDVRTAYDGSGRLQLIVPADFVDRAVFPIVVDPVVGPAISIAGAYFGILLTPSAAVARDYERGRYCVAWSTGDASNPITAARLFNRDGVPVGSVQNIAGAVDAIAYCKNVAGDAYVVVRSVVLASGNRRIEARLLSAQSAAPISAWYPISPPASAATGGDANPTVCGPGVGLMMVAWQRIPPGDNAPRQILLRDITWSSPSSAPILGPERTLDSVVAPQLVANVRLADSDVQVGAIGLPPWHFNRAVWQRFYSTPAPGDWDLVTASFQLRSSPAAFVLRHGPTLVSGAANIGIDETVPDIASRAPWHTNPAWHEYLAVWQSGGDIRGQRFDDDGEIGNPIPIDSGAHDFELPAVGAGGCEYTVAYRQTSTATAFGARVLADGTLSINRRPLGMVGTGTGRKLAISSRPILDVTTESDNRSMVVGCGGVSGFTGSSITAWRFDNVAADLVPFGSACPGPLGELPTIGAIGNAYPGNDLFALTVNNAPANSVALLAISGNFSSVPIPGAPGCWLYAGLPLLDARFLVTTAIGAGAVTLPIPCGVPNGAGLAFQWLVLTPGHNPAGAIASDDLDVHWSHF